MTASGASMTSLSQQRRRRRFGEAMVMAAVVLISLPSSREALVTNSNSAARRRSTLNMRISSSSPSSSASKIPIDDSKKKEGFEFVPAARRSSLTTPSRQPQPAVSPLRALVENQDRQEFEMNLGRAVDILKHDYPDILTEPPDYSIYDPNLEIIDPAGVKLHGLKNYKNAFRLVHTIVNLFYCPERSLLTYRLVYDWARNCIRVSWNAEVVPKKIFGGTKTTLHVDGISVYVMSSKSGKIVQHRVEHLMINDNLIAPERGIIHALQKQCVDPDCTIPVFNTEGGPPTGMVKFQTNNPLQFMLPGKSTSLFSSPSAMAGSSDPSQYPDNFNLDAFQEKNKSRKKFGLKPLTPEEFLELEAQVKQMDMQQKQRASAAAEASSSSTTTKEPNFFERMLGNVLEDTCESNFDCERPELCCDFGFKKMCCMSGSFVGSDQKRFGERATVPVVAGPYPPGLGPQDPPRRF